MPAKRVDLVGRRFGKLIVIERLPKTKNCTHWKCQCDCGNTTIVQHGNLISGSTESCGCNVFYDLLNKRFGRLVVIARGENKRYKHSTKVRWICKCDCGSIVEVNSDSLRRGRTTSCSCYNREISTKHGLSGTKEYKRATYTRYMDQKLVLDGSWSVEMEKELRKLFNCCCVCGMTEEEHQKKYKQSLHLDHVLPLSKGHGLKPGNVVLLCKFHNISKKDRQLMELPVEWQVNIIWDAFNFKDGWENHACIIG